MARYPKPITAACVMVCLTVACGTTSPRPGPSAAAPMHDANELFARMDRVTVQIVRGSARMSEAHYQTEVRPKLRERLGKMGFADQQADQILARVDDARADRAQVRRWWAGMRGGEPQRQRTVTASTPAVPGATRAD